MIIFENHSWQKDSDFPDTNYLEGSDCEQPKWVVHDNSEVACKILSTYFWDPVEDGKGNLVDITAAEASIGDEERIKVLKAKLDMLDRQAIRPLRAIAAGTDTEEDRKILAELEQQANEIREQLSEIENKDAESSGEEI